MVKIYPRRASLSRRILCCIVHVADPWTSSLPANRDARVVGLFPRRWIFCRDFVFLPLVATCITPRDWTERSRGAAATRLGNVSVELLPCIHPVCSSFSLVFPLFLKVYCRHIPFLLRTFREEGTSNNASFTITRKTFAEFRRCSHSQGALRIPRRWITYFAIQQRSFGKPPGLQSVCVVAR